MPWPKAFFIKEKPTRTKSKNYDCGACGLYKGCKSPKMLPTGEGHLNILAVAESPGREEDERGIQLIGDAGQLLREKLAVHGLDLDRDFWKTNVICCRPFNNREPTLSELKCCMPRLFEAIGKYKPKMIWLMGNVAIESYFLFRRFKNKTISLWRKRCIPDPLTNAWIVPLLHPSFVLRNKGNKNVESVYDRDLKWAVGLINKPAPIFPDYEKQLHLITNYDQLLQILQQLEKIEKPIPFIFDYETTGIKPHNPENKIVSIAFCLDEDAYSFPYQYPGSWTEKQLGIIKQKWLNALVNPNLKKVAHGLKFENDWTKYVFNIQPTPWESCSMTLQHVLDGRTGGAGLKFQVFTRWGLIYDEIIEPFKKEIANGLNKMDEAPLLELLKYGASDSLFGFWLYQEQQKELSLNANTSLRKASDFFHEGLLAFADMEESGLNVDMNYYKSEDKRLDVKIKQLENKLHSTPIAKDFETKEEKVINWGSNKDLSKLLFEYLNIKSVKKTSSGKNESVDADALEMYAKDYPIIRDLILKRKLEKIKNTYLTQFTREEFNGKIYPIFNLHTTRTYRSSCDSPNFQNIPTRDEEARKSTRMGIIPTPGNQLLEADFSGMEVRIAACYTGDEVLINYIKDSTSDMHRDQASLLFKLPNELITKEIRFEAKNGWVFPLFYGSYYVSCARNLWGRISSLKLSDGKPLQAWLKENKIITYTGFEERCKKLEQEFWDRFKTFRKWQEQTIISFQRKGFVEMYHGFRRGGLLDQNQIINSGIQGSAFHCLLWCLIQINKVRKKERWKTTIPGQIHDSIIFDLNPVEKEHVIQTLHRIATKDLVEAHKWIITPMEIELEIAPINRSWFEKKPLALK